MTEGKTYALSARVSAREKGSGWQRNNRARLIAFCPGGDTSGRNRSLEHALKSNALREEHATQWYSPQGRWQRFRLRFTAQAPTAVVCVALYRWWALEEDAVFVDDVWLE